MDKVYAIQVCRPEFKSHHSDKNEPGWHGHLPVIPELVRQRHGVLRTATLVKSVNSGVSERLLCGGNAH